MYEQFFGLTGKPFQLMPDARFFYKSVGHQRALAYMRYGLQQAQGFIVITGDVGTGKSTLVSTLARELDPEKLLAAKVVCSRLDDEQLLTVVSAAFGLPHEGRGKAALLIEFEQFCKAAIDRGQRVLIVVDEVQNLPPSGLEELRMLSNMDYRGQPIVQSFLLGQREFRQTMRSQGMEQLRQRVIAAYHLRPLADGEVRKYILHRLKTVGWREDPQIEEGVFNMVTRASGGVPRRINLLMDRLLLNCAIDETHVVDELRTKEIVEEIELEVGQGPLPALEAADPDETSDDLSSSAAIASKASAEIDALKAELQALKRQQANMMSSPDMLAASQPTLAVAAVQVERTRDDIEVVRRSAGRWRTLFLLGLILLLGVGLTGGVMILQRMQ